MRRPMRLLVMQYGCGTLVQFWKLFTQFYYMHILMLSLSYDFVSF